MHGALVIFCGIPGSGKTTIANLVAKKLGQTVHIQTDVIRSMVSQPKYTGRESKFVYSSVTAVAREALKSGYHAILDGTYLREEFREEPARGLAGLYGTLLVVHIACDAAVAYRRNISRPETVPRESFLRLYSQFRPPRTALRIDSEKISSELASEAVILQVTSSHD